MTTRPMRISAALSRIILPRWPPIRSTSKAREPRPPPMVRGAILYITIIAPVSRQRQPLTSSSKSRSRRSPPTSEQELTHMMNQAVQYAQASEAYDRPIIASVPRVNIQAFCENQPTVQAVQAAAADRRMSRAHVTIQLGGMMAAVQVFRSQPT